MKKIDLCIFVGLICAIMLSNFGAFAKQYNNLTGNVLRLHIPANSDSAEDQELKLKVRDAILTESIGLFGSENSMSETEQIVLDNLDDIKNIVNRVISENGYDYEIKCELINMYFDARQYDEFTMPAGNYDALRITIGEAVGKNWWCVMYPPLCVPSAMEISDEVFSAGELDMLKNPQKYEIKFKFMELIMSFMKNGKQSK